MPARRSFRAGVPIRRQPVDSPPGRDLLSEILPPAQGSFRSLEPASPGAFLPFLTADR